MRQEIAVLAKRLGVRAETIDVDRLNLNSLADIVRGTSLFRETRLVVLRQLSEHKELWTKLGDWARDVSADTTLVLVETKPDKRTKAYKTLARAGDRRRAVNGTYALSGRSVAAGFSACAERRGLAGASSQYGFTGARTE